MESIAPLLDRARRAGLVVLHEGDRLIVRGPRRLAALAAELLDRKADVLSALQSETVPVVTAEADACAPSFYNHEAETEGSVTAETDPGVAMALEVFPSARVVAFNQPAVWPPEGGWIPSSARPIDVYGTEAPTVPCPCCGAMMWSRAGDGWCCRRCHPDPREPRADGSTKETDPCAQPVFQQAAAKGFPAASLAPVHPGATVVPTEDGWRGFVRTATSDELAAATAALARIASDASAVVAPSEQHSGSTGPHVMTSTATAAGDTSTITETMGHPPSGRGGRDIGPGTCEACAHFDEVRGWCRARSFETQARLPSCYEWFVPVASGAPAAVTRGPAHDQR